MSESEFVWVFNGDNARFPAGVFRTKTAAMDWIAENALTGVLTGYPLDEGTYDWAVRSSKFTPKSEKHRTSAFISKFTSGAQPHYHFQDGKECYPPVEAGGENDTSVP